MSLEMRTVCERCGAALADDGLAFICSYECTFCTSCGRAGTRLPELRRGTGGAAQTPTEGNAGGVSQVYPY